MISLCMIVRNEADCLERCLTSAKPWVDEIIIVDTGSTDTTLKLAKQFTQHVFAFAWCDDFAAARNYSLSKASGDWILVLDADEELVQKTAPLLRDLVSTTEDYSACLIPVMSLLNETIDDYQTSLVLRLFRNHPDLRFQGKIHEQIIVPADHHYIMVEAGPVILHRGYLPSRLKLKQGRNQSLLKQALATEPENPYLHYYLATEFINQQQYHEALPYIRWAYEQIADEVLVFKTACIRNLALCLHYTNHNTQAIELLLTEQAKHPNFCDFSYLLGWLYQTEGNYPQAIANYSRALAQPDAPLLGRAISGSNGYRAYYHRGQCSQGLHRHFAAINDFTTALKENPLFPLPFAELVSCLLFVGGPTACLAYLAEHFQLSHPVYQLELSRLFAENGYVCEAAAVLQAYTDEKDLEYVEIATWILLLQGKDCEAQQLINRSERSTQTLHLFKLFICWKQNRPACKEAGDLWGPPEFVQLVKAIDCALWSDKDISYQPQTAELAWALLLYEKAAQLKLTKVATTLSAWIAKAGFAWSLKLVSIDLGAGRVPEHLPIPSNHLEAKLLRKTYYRLAEQQQIILPKLANGSEPSNDKTVHSLHDY